jgi:hypothetical protein
MDQGLLSTMTKDAEILSPGHLQTRPRYLVPAAVFLLLGFSLVIVGQTVQPAAKGITQTGAPTSQIVASRPYTVGAKSRKLTLVRSDVAPLSDFELIDYLRKNPKQNSFPNRAFALVDSPNGEAVKQDLIWIAYVFHNKAMPLQVLNGDVIWDPIKKEAYVGILNSNTARVLVSIYRVDPQHRIGSYPLDLDPKKHQEWPLETAPLTQFEIGTSKIGFCGLKSIEFSLAQEQLRIRGERVGDTCHPVIFNLNLETMQWSEAAP